MVISQEEKFKHPEYFQYLELYERTITGLEASARGRGAPEAIIAACLKTAMHFYEADSAALVETDAEIGYGTLYYLSMKTAGIIFHVLRLAFLLFISQAYYINRYTPINESIYQFTYTTIHKKFLSLLRLPTLKTI